MYISIRATLVVIIKKVISCNLKKCLMKCKMIAFLVFFSLLSPLVVPINSNSNLNDISSNYTGNSSSNDCYTGVDAADNNMSFPPTWIANGSNLSTVGGTCSGTLNGTNDLMDKYRIYIPSGKYLNLSFESSEIIYVETPQNSQVSFLHPGFGFRPLHACSCAKVIAAFSSESFQLSIIRSRLKSYTRNTRTNSNLLQTEFKNIRAKGYAECVQEIEVGICSVAAPVFVQDLGVFLSLGATGPLRLFANDFRETIGAYLIELSKEFGDLIYNRNAWANGTIALAS